MQDKQAVSLQHRLVKTSVFSSIAAGLISLLLLLGISIYQTMHLQDEIMDEISDMLLLTDITKSSGHQIDELSDQFDIHYRLIYEGQTLTQSEDAQNDVFKYLIQHPAEQGYSIMWHKEQLWRTFVQNESDMTLYAVQPLKIRFEEIISTAAGYAAILAVLWCLQWLIVHMSVKRQFKSIHALSHQISEKSADDLEPIISPQPELAELQPMVQQLNYMLERVKQALIAEQRFTADASHELRSPLSAIQMRVQVLNRKYQDHPQLQAELLHIQQDVRRGTQVLENLLLLARLDPSKPDDLPKAQIDLADVTHDVLLALAPFMQQKDIHVDTQMNSLTVFANAELLFTCLRNLVDNAMRYSNAHGQLQIQILDAAQQATWMIEDNGTEVTEDVLQRMGERFYRALGTQTQGTGLGLSICKKIIELHNGKIVFSKSSLGGLKVQVVLPKHTEFISSV
ncbi:sensor histidine kinase [Acinetobacter pragensis]|uniref:histidine kinase n=1 Tax=Acinetobacter pragensis TaxID=1806892 RepID=A0A151XZE3_9GAMM|nr:HAMP domain-containing sensor histidine kinase [Acinetobacter pragensis]KYQ71054.1 two-component sensor histidine kinase [Acinetobacter pragensis]